MQIRTKILHMYTQEFQVPSEQIRLTFLRIPELAASSGQADAIEVLNQRSKLKLGYHTFMVRFLRSGLQIKKAPVSVEAAIECPVVVAKHKIRRQRSIEANAVSLKIRRIDHDWDLVCRNIRQVVGQEASQLIRKDRLIFKNMVQLTPLVHRGDQVKLQICSGNLTIESLAIAKRSGILGDLIPIENKMTGKRLTGRVEGRGMVVIPQEDQL